MLMVFGGILILLFISALIGIGRYFYMKFRYKTVASNEVMVITGRNIGDSDKESNIFKDEENGRHMKIVRGGGHLLRFKQTATLINLNSFQLKLSTPKIYTNQGVGIFGEAVATIKVADTLEGIVKYAEQFLGKKQGEIENEISEVLGSNLRAILSKMTVEEINGDRESFNEQVREIAQNQLDQMGFKITSLGLTNIKDEEGYLENLGRPQISAVRKQAEIAESTDERETRVHIAEMNEEIAKEELSREMSIADAQREKEVNDSRILAETNQEKAKAEATYELEREERRLEIEEQRIKILEQEKEGQLRLQVLEQENEVELEEKRAEVRKKHADATLYEKEKEAEAEAKLIEAKSQAEVESIERRAEALQKHKDVMITEMVIKMMPEFAKAVAEPMSNVESIRIMDGGSGKQVNSLPNMVTSTMANLQEGLGQMTGIDLNDIINSVAGTTDGASIVSSSSDDVKVFSSNGDKNVSDEG